MTFIIQAGPIEDRRTICAGDLLPCTESLHELKLYFDGLPDYENLHCLFATPKGAVDLELNLSVKGYAGKCYRGSSEFGVNLNRVRARQDRWGVTVWHKSNRHEQSEDLTKVLEAIR